MSDRELRNRERTDDDGSRDRGARRGRRRRRRTRPAAEADRRKEPISFVEEEKDDASSPERLLAEPPNETLHAALDHQRDRDAAERHNRAEVRKRDGGDRGDRDLQRDLAGRQRVPRPPKEPTPCGCVDGLRRFVPQ
jgi:hypothetical protein